MNIRRAVAGLVSQAVEAVFPQACLGTDDIAPLLELPPDAAMGDFAFPCFQLSRQLRMGPPQIAQRLAGAVSASGLARAEVKGGYLNFFFSRPLLAKGVLEDIASDPEAWGSSEQGKGKTVCIDYSSINIAKRFHIGHLSTTAIGHSLKRIYGFLGWRTVGINHLGDWGTQFGKMIAAYRHWGSREMVEEGGVQALRVLGEEERRRHRQRGGDHAADHHLEAERPGLLHRGERLGEPARLVELDVDRVVAAHKRLEGGAVMHGFIGAYGHGPFDASEHGVVSGRQRLLHQLHAELRGCGQKRLGFMGLPGLVGIGDQPCLGQGGPDRQETLRIAFTAELQFEQRKPARGRGLSGHGLGGGE